MPVAIDTSVLIAAEQGGAFDRLLPENEQGPYYIPALAAAEYLAGTHPPVRTELRQRASRLYHTRWRSIVSSFTEADAAQLSTLIAELRARGQQMKFFDAAIAATAMARGDKLLALDSDFDRLSGRLQLLRPAAGSGLG